jgi:hypothetical protein
MAADFTLKIGTLNLAHWIRVSPGEGFDPYDQDFIEPIFGQSPLSEGQPQTGENIGNREMQWPLILGSAGIVKQDLHNQIAGINREIRNANPRQIQWADKGATVTYYDFEAARVEPDYNFRRGEQNRANAVLRAWTRPFGHTNEWRTVASIAASGVFARVAMPSTVLGDRPAHSRFAIQPGSYAQDGRMLVMGVLPHASYPGRIPAASISLQTDASPILIGASGAPGSQLIGLWPIFSGVNATRGLYGKAHLSPASLYAGKPHRVIQAVRSNYWGGHAVYAKHLGELVGPTVAARHEPFSWQLVDLGLLRVPSDPITATLTLDLHGAAMHVKDSPGQIQDTASWALMMGDVFVLPEELSAVVVDDDREVIVRDTFYNNIAVVGSAQLLTGRIADITGQTWHTATEIGSWSLYIAAEGDPNIKLATSPAAGAWRGNRLDTGLTLEDCAIEFGYHHTTSGSASGVLAVRKSATFNHYVEAQVNDRPSGYLSMYIVVGGATTLLGSVGVPSLHSADFRLRLRTLGPVAELTLEPLSLVPTAYINTLGTGVIASVGGSHAAVPMRGDLVVAMNSGDDALYHPVVYSLASRGVGAGDIYELDPQRAYRLSNASGLTEHMARWQRGAVPQTPVPTGGAAFFMAAGRGARRAPGNDLLNASLQVRERFTYAR